MHLYSLMSVSDLLCRTHFVLVHVLYGATGSAPQPYTSISLFMTLATCREVCNRSGGGWGRHRPQCYNNTGRSIRAVDNCFGLMESNPTACTTTSLNPLYKRTEQGTVHSVWHIEAILEENKPERPSKRTTQQLKDLFYILSSFWSLLHWITLTYVTEKRLLLGWASCSRPFLARDPILTSQISGDPRDIFSFSIISFWSCLLCCCKYRVARLVHKVTF